MKNKAFTSYTLFAFSKSELERLMAACSHLEDYIMILLASRYGFRRDDIVKLRIKNINLEHSTLTYHEQKKNKDRTIPLEPDVVNDLKRYINTLPKDQISLDFLLPFRDGTTAWRHLQELCAVAGIPTPPGRTGRPFHALRGTCVKQRQLQGWTISEVAALIGDDIATVQLHYATVSPSELAAKMAGGK